MQKLNCLVCFLILVLAGQSSAVRIVSSDGQPDLIIHQVNELIRIYTCVTRTDQCKVRIITSVDELQWASHYHEKDKLIRNKALFLTGGILLSVLTGGPVALVVGDAIAYSLSGAFVVYDIQSIASFDRYHPDIKRAIDYSQVDKVLYAVDGNANRLLNYILTTVGDYRRRTGYPGPLGVPSITSTKDNLLALTFD